MAEGRAQVGERETAGDERERAKENEDGNNNNNEKSVS